MNRILLLILSMLFIFSCSKDDGPTVEQCNKPTNIQVTDITHDSVTITWDTTNENATFSVEYGISGFTQGSGTSVTSATTSTSISGLTSETAYDFYITADCGDNNISMATSVTTFSTVQPPVVAQFLTNLSDLNIYTGDLSDLTPSDYAFEYDLVTPLFTDYAYKQRLLALPSGTSLEYQDGDGLPDFPDNTVIAKTFYYNVNDSDESLGKIILETRILIKINGEWETGNYKWNDEQTEATLTLEGHVVPTTYTDASGGTVNLDYEIPSNTDCFTCHNINSTITPIGPKVRTLNFNGQLQTMINSNLISNISTEGDAASLPNWEDTSLSLDDRARAYLDVNCAHCHQPGGDCADESTLDFRFETRFSDTFIFDFKESIFARMISYDIDGYGMPLIGTTVLHQEGFDLIDEYIDSL